MRTWLLWPDQKNLRAATKRNNDAYFFTVRLFFFNITRSTSTRLASPAVEEGSYQNSHTYREATVFPRLSTTAV